jgi:hypothetical protein
MIFMNTALLAHAFSLLLTGAPSPATPNFGPWVHFVWVIILLGLCIFVCWWLWGKIGGKIPEPLHTIVFVLGCVALAAAVIFWVLIPLMGVF